MSNSSKILLPYILKPEGKIEPLDIEDIPSKLISVNILYFYHYEKKRLYIWIGKNAGKKLKQTIPTAEEIILKKNPDITIIRHFTVDEGSETHDFWQDTALNPENIRKIQQKWSEFRLDQYALLDKLRINMTSAKNTGDFENAINYIEQILKVAEEIYDWDLIDEFTQLRDQILRVKDLRSRKDEIKREIPHKIAKLDKLMAENEVIKAHDLAVEIQEYYSILFNEPIPRKFQRSLDSEKMLYDEYIRIKKDINDLQERFNEFLPERNLRTLYRIGKKLVQLNEKFDDITIDQSMMEQISLIEAQYKEWEKSEREYRNNITTLTSAYQRAKSNYEFDEAQQHLEKIIELIQTSDHKSELEQWETEISNLKELKKQWELQKEEAKKKKLENRDKIKQMQAEIEQQLHNRNFPETFASVEKLYLFASQTHDEEIEKEIANYRKEINEKITNLKLLDILLKKISEWEESFPELKKTKQYDTILSDLNIFLSDEAINYSLEHKARLSEIKSSIEELKEKYSKNVALYNRLSTEIKENENKEQWMALTRNAKRIQEILPEIDKENEHIKFQEIENLANQKIKEKEKKKEEELAQLLNKAKEIENIIQSEKKILPLVEDLSLEDILPNLSTDVNEMLTQIESVLDKQRVEVKDDMESSMLLTSASGETMEITAKIQVSMESASLDKETLEISPFTKFKASSVLENPFHDAISEVIIEDIIPYNFEISDINVEGGDNFEKPEEQLHKDGFVLKWKLNNIPAQNSVKINYELRKRVSRTILIPLETQLKVIKTHTSIKDYSPEGLYDVTMFFKNKFAKSVIGVVIEDIIPTFYHFQIKLPKDALPASQVEQPIGALIKWNYHEILENKELKHQYRLLNLAQFENLKILVDKLTREAYNTLERGDIDKSLATYQKIVKKLRKFT
ncbi:MAG: hypothetical protein ACTSWC_03525 [Promethearchaeota archaeon]